MDANFPRDKLFSMKDFLALREKEKDVEEEDSSRESGSSGAFPLLPVS